MRLAEQAPTRLRGEGAIGRATGVLAIRFGIDVVAAQQRLEDAAPGRGSRLPSSPSP